MFDPWPRLIDPKILHAAEQLNPSAAATEFEHQRPGANYRSLRVQSLCSATREASRMRRLRTITGESLPFSASREKPMQQQRPSTARKKKNK